MRSVICAFKLTPLGKPNEAKGGVNSGERGVNDALRKKSGHFAYFLL